jgi:hypothetical protein
MHNQGIQYGLFVCIRCRDDKVERLDGSYREECGDHCGHEFAAEIPPLWLDDDLLAPCSCCGDTPHLIEPFVRMSVLARELAAA